MPTLQGPFDEVVFIYLYLWFQQAGFVAFIELNAYGFYFFKPRHVFLHSSKLALTDISIIFASVMPAQIKTIAAPIRGRASLDWAISQPLLWLPKGSGGEGYSSISCFPRMDFHPNG